MLGSAGQRLLSEQPFTGVFGLNMEHRVPGKRRQRGLQEQCWFWGFAYRGADVTGVVRSPVSDAGVCTAQAGHGAALAAASPSGLLRDVYMAQGTELPKPIPASCVRAQLHILLGSRDMHVS